MLKKFLPAILLLAASVAAAETAQTVMTAATTEASATHKAVMVVFHASWCGWCKRYDEMLADAVTGPLLRKYYVVAKVDVLEEEEKAALNTPGGDALLDQLGGKEQGLPFIAIVDSASKPIVTSTLEATGKSIGYPFEPEEIVWFMTMLKKSAPAMQLTETKTIENWIKSRAK